MTSIGNTKPTLDELAKLPNTYSKTEWWKEAVVYQIYPSTFADGNGDGIGDLKGVLNNIDHIASMGVDAVWFSPVYPSPNFDQGYDVADYRDIHPDYGTLEEMDQIISELGKRGIKVMQDLVVNHTSYEHAWFKESSSSRDNPKADWYIWRDPKYDAEGNRKEPNNWVSFFCGSAWTWNETRQQYYLSLFTPEQPDLNWEEPLVREGVHDIMRFWLDRGCAGFRMDVINSVSKTYVNDGSKYPDLPDAPITDPNAKYQQATSLFCDGPRIHEFMQELNEKVLSKYDTITVGESPFLEDPNQLLLWTHPARKELRCNFHFVIVNVDSDDMAPIKPREWTLPELKWATLKWQTFCHRENAWTSVYGMNHDQATPTSRWLNDSPQYRKQSAKTHALHQTTLSGTLYLYASEELGKINIPKDWPLSDYPDVMTVNYAKECAERRASGDKTAPDESTVLSWAQHLARDNGRVPFAWTSEENGGFSPANVKPWMRCMTEDAKAGWNAQDEAKDATSVMNFWKQALKVRKEYKHLLVYGGLAPLFLEDPNIFAYAKYSEGHPTLLVIMNFSGSKQTVTVHPDEAEQSLRDIKEEKYWPLGPLPELKDLKKRSKVILETTEGLFKGWNQAGEGESVEIEPYQGFLLELA